MNFLNDQGFWNILYMYRIVHQYLFMQNIISHDSWVKFYVILLLIKQNKLFDWWWALKSIERQLYSLLLRPIDRIRYFSLSFSISGWKKHNKNISQSIINTLKLFFTRNVTHFIDYLFTSLDVIAPSIETHSRFYGHLILSFHIMTLTM